MTTSTTRPSLTSGQLLALLLGSALVGMDSGIFATYGSHLLEEAALSSSQLQQLWLTYGLFTLIAAFGGGLLLRRLSRRQALLIGAGAYSVALLAGLHLHEAALLYPVRAIAGLGTGLLLLVPPLYLGETHEGPPRRRRLAAIHLAMMLGFFASYLLSSGAAPLVVSGSLLQLGIGLLPAVLLFILSRNLPDSPADRQPIWSADALRSRQSPAWMYGLVLLVIFQAITGIYAIDTLLPGAVSQSGLEGDGQRWLALTHLSAAVLALLLVAPIRPKALLSVGLLVMIAGLVIASIGYQQASYQLPATAFADMSDQVDPTVLYPLMDQTFEEELAFEAALTNLLGETAFNEHRSLLFQAGTIMDARLVLIGLLVAAFGFSFGIGTLLWVWLGEIPGSHGRTLIAASLIAINSAAGMLAPSLLDWQMSTWGTGTALIITAGIALLAAVLLSWLLPVFREEAVVTTANETVPA